jgi:hypothetical protein
VILDLISGVLCGWFALCLCFLHVYSSPKSKHWMTFPGYLRFGFVISAAMLMVRSVNYLTLHHDTAAGHANLVSVAATLTLTYTFTAMSVWLAGRRLLPVIWDRLRWVEHKERENPELIPVLKEPAEVAAELRARGFVAVPPAAPPEALRAAITRH